MRKKEGGLRPIAIGYTLRHLAGKCANKYATAKLASHFAPIQLGIGTPGGAEAAIHAVRRYAENLPKDYIIAKLDFKTAFNTLRRDTMLEAIRRELPELYNFAHATYNGAPVLQFGDFTIHSAEGPQQGDPLSSAEYCLAIHPLLRRLISELKVDYLDDVTLSGHRQIVVDDIKTIISKSEELSHELNAAKCEVTYCDTSTPHDDHVLKTFERVGMADLTLFGAPILPGRAVDKALKEKTEVGEGDVHTPFVAVSRCSHSAPEQHQRFKAPLHSSIIRV